MQIEELYRAAIVALKNRQWEQATRNLLTVVEAAPQREDATRVLMQLERLHPISYWRGAFMYAIERNAWEQAETAAARLKEIDPALQNADSVATHLQELTAIGWYLPQSPADPAESEPAQADSGAEVAPPAPTESEPDAGTETSSVDDITTPDVPFDRAALLDLAAAWPLPVAEPPSEPTAGPQTPDGVTRHGSNADLPGMDRSPRALKAAEFSETARDVDLETQRGPIYDTLSWPRALKAAHLLEQASETETLPQEDAPAFSLAARSPGDSLKSTSAPSGPLGDAFMPQGDASPVLPTEVQPAPDPPPFDAAAEITRPYRPVQTPPVPAPARAPASPVRQRLIVAVFLAILIGMLVLIARLARNGTPADPAASPTATFAENSDLSDGALPTLIAGLDLVFSGEEAADAAVENRWRAQIETLTAADSGLRNALLTWMEAGQHSQAAHLRLAETCAQADTEPAVCESLQTDYDLWASRARLARNVVCIMTECPAA